MPCGSSRRARTRARAAAVAAAGVPPASPPQQGDKGPKTTRLPTPDHLSEGRATLRALKGGLKVDPIVDEPSSAPSPSTPEGKEIDLSDMGTCCSQETASGDEGPGGASGDMGPTIESLVLEEPPTASTHRRPRGFLSCFRGIFRRSPRTTTAPVSSPVLVIPSVASLVNPSYGKTYACQSGTGVTGAEVEQVLGASAHRRACFTEMLEREVEMSQDWAFFYHCYNSSFLVYEVQGVLAEILYGYNCTRAPLPRLLQATKYPDAPSLVKGITGGDFVRPHPNDHNPKFREGGFCGTTSIFAGAQSEALLSRFFESGYSGANAPDLRGALVNLMESVGVEAPSQLVQKITALAPPMAGHLLQIAVRKPAVDLFAYPCFAGGTHDNAREPLSKHIAKRTQNSQVRMAANPALLLHEHWFQIHYYQGQPGFDRLKLHDSLRSLLRPSIPERTLRWGEIEVEAEQGGAEEEVGAGEGAGGAGEAGSPNANPNVPDAPGAEDQAPRQGSEDQASPGLLAWLLECALLLPA